MTTPALTAGDRAALLEIARAAALGPAAAPATPASGPLAGHRGAVVTITMGEDVRGSFGTLAPTAPLAEAVAEAARRAAFHDPRFPPIRPDEAGALRLQVAVLGPAVAVPLEDRAEAVRPGHGIAVARGLHRAALLPGHARRAGWDGAAFLKHACLQAGLHARAWQEPATDVWVFEADEFGEEAAR